MSNGDSLDGFVFPPFIPTASTRPPQAPPAPPAPPAAQEPAPSAEASGRMTMPWDLETPIVRQADAPAATPQEATADDEDDLPWLEVPAPREPDVPAAEAAPAPAGDDAFPDWLAWDQRDETGAEADARDSVAPVAGLEDFVPVDDLGAGFVAPAPAVEWAESEPEASAATAEPGPGFDAAPPHVLEATPEPEPFTEGVFDAPAADVADEADAWSLAAPEAAEPPAVDEAPLPSFDESPAAAEPSFELSVEDGALTIEPAAAAPEPAPAPFVADAEAVIAAEPAPFVPDAEPAAAAEPDPFTAASVAEAEAAAPAEPADSPFDDVAARLEGIARMLRERPDELLAGGSPDPLALLVTGYVMGYTARGGR